MNMYSQTVQINKSEYSVFTETNSHRWQLLELDRHRHTEEQTYKQSNIQKVPL